MEGAVKIFRNLLAFTTLNERNPAPRGGFLFTMFPDQEPGRKNNPQIG